MIQAIRRTILPLLFATTVLTANAQFDRLKGGSISIGATGVFSTTVTSSPTNVTTNASRPTGGVLAETVSGQQQFTTDSVGGLASFQFHPVAWAGVEFNYAMMRYSERYLFNYSSVATPQAVSVPVFAHEATGAYQFHPRHIPFQPFVNIGGGAISFLPAYASNQWRGTGLVETGFDIPTHMRVGLRVEGRALIYRSPNFSNPTLSSRSWRVTEEPSISAYYRF